METEIKWPIDFPKCPNCGCEMTVTWLACRELIEKGIIKEGEFVSQRKLITPLVGAASVTLTMPALVTHYDICAKCGLDYCTRAEKAELPVTTQKLPGPGRGRFPPEGPFPPAR